MTSTHRIPDSAGIGLRLAHLAETVAARPPIGWLEAHPENFLANPHATELLIELSADYPISLHTVGIPIGSAGGIDRLHCALEVDGSFDPGEALAALIAAGLTTAIMQNA
jgi:uncharacterized protein